MWHTQCPSIISKSTCKYRDGTAIKHINKGSIEDKLMPYFQVTGFLYLL